MTGGAFYKLRPEIIQQVGCLAASLLAFLEHKIDFHGRTHSGAWYHSQTRIAAELGMTPWQVRQSLKILVESGLLKVTKNAGPNRTDGFECVRGTRGEHAPVRDIHTPVRDIHTPIKLDKTNKKESMQACKEMPACSSSIDWDCQELVEAIRPLELNDRDNLSLAKEAKAGSVTVQELTELVADVQSKNPKNPGGLLRVKLRGSDVQRLRSKQTEAHEADVRRRIEANADLLVDRLQQRFGVGAHFMAELDRKSGTYRLRSGHTFNLKVNSEVLVGQINSYKPSANI